MPGMMSVPAVPLPSAVQLDAPERRRSGRRARALDRVLDRATQPYPQNSALAAVKDIENLILFVDDDLRETGLALQRIEGYLTRTLQTLESPEVRRSQVHALATEQQVLEHLDLLCETLEQLRRRLAKLAVRMKR
jgi:hypothetical protein